MERKIGEIFEYDGEWYQCIRSSDCPKCDLKIIKDCRLKFPCESLQREDCEDVIFKRLEKVGEPMKIHNRLVLKVKADAYKCMRCCFYSKGKCELTMQECEHYDCGEEYKFVELKQTKEDMEEKKLNIKPFSLEAAKAGKPVCTRDGRKARIICFDRKGKQPIIALIIQDNGEEFIENYHLSGRFNVDDTFENDGDLMMLPEKKEGWVNVYRDCDGANITKDDNIYSSKEAAMASAQVIDRDNYVATTIINWEKHS